MVGYVPDDLKRLLHNGHGEMGPIIHQSGYVIFRHLRQLLLKDAFEPCQNYKALPFAVVIDHSKFDIAISFLRNRRLVTNQIVSQCTSRESLLGMNIRTFSGYGTMVNGFLSSMETECEFLMRLLGVGGSSCSAAFRLGSLKYVSTMWILYDRRLTFKNHRCHVVAGLAVFRCISMRLAYKRGAAIGVRNSLPRLAVGADSPGGPSEFSSIK